MDSIEPKGLRYDFNTSLNSFCVVSLLGTNENRTTPWDASLSLYSLILSQDHSTTIKVTPGTFFSVATATIWGRARCSHFHFFNCRYTFSLLSDLLANCTRMLHSMQQAQLDIISMLGPRASVRGRVLLLPRERGGRAARVRIPGGGGSIGEEGKEVIRRA